MTGNPERKTIIGVIGSGNRPYPTLSAPLGKWIAQQGFHLVNGGGPGTMADVARAFIETPGREGRVIGVLPADQPCITAEEKKNYRSPAGYPNDFVEIPIRTHLSLSGSSGMDQASRNHIVVLTSDLVVALPGSSGTRSEIQLALQYKKPLVILNQDDVWNEFKQSSAAMVATVEGVFETILEWTRVRGPNA